jgi:uncharacterized protein
MPETSVAPDLKGVEVVMDAWTEPFWQAAASGTLLLPRCADCARFRWPPGPFCPQCQSQRTEWVPPGSARIYTFTILRIAPGGGGTQLRVQVPALIEFPDAGGTRFPAAIVDTPLAAIRIGAQLALGWSPAANARVPVFRVI